MVNNAGISISKPVADHSIEDWDKLYDILVKGQFLVSKLGVEVMRKQGFGGDIINIVSKNSVVSGPNNAGYGSAKAAQAHLSRLLAAELGPDKIRVNSVNPMRLLQIAISGPAVGPKAVRKLMASPLKSCLLIMQNAHCSTRRFCLKILPTPVMLSSVGCSISQPATH